MQYWRSSSRTTERGRKSVSCCNSLAMQFTQVQLNLAVQSSPTMAGTNSTTVQWRLQTSIIPKAALLSRRLLVPTSMPSSLCASKTTAEPTGDQIRGVSRKVWTLLAWTMVQEDCYGRVGEQGQEHLSWNCSQMLCILKPQLWIHCLAETYHILHLLR